MANRRLGRGAWVLASVAAAALAVVLPAAGDNAGLTIFTSSLAREPGTAIGAGGDGTLVLYSSYSQMTPPEKAISAADLVTKPYLDFNMDLFSWEPGVDAVRQFTATSNIESKPPTGYFAYTENDEPAVVSRTFTQPVPAGSRLFAVAFRSNADQAIPGPVASFDAVDPRILALGGVDHTVFVWDSEKKVMINVLDPNGYSGSMDVGEPAIAMRTMIPEVPGTPSEQVVPVISDVLVAFSGNLPTTQDNGDGNSEIYLWSRKAHFEALTAPAGIANNGGVTQITHTRNGDCWSPTVNEAGDVAFVSNSTDIVPGQNDDGNEELFVWRKGKFTQVTNTTDGFEEALGFKATVTVSITSPRWAAKGRRLVFASNEDNNDEIYSWNGKTVRQLTSTTTGGCTSPSVDAGGNRIAFLCDGNLPGVTVSGRAEVVVMNKNGKNVRQVTHLTDEGFNGAPTLTRSPQGTFQATWVSNSNLDGRNSNNLERIYRSNVR